MSANKDPSLPPSLQLVGEGPAYRAKIERALRRSALFADFPDDDLRALAQYLELHTAERGTAVIVEGARAGFMGIVIEGRLEIFKDNGRGESRLITEVGPGGSVGEMSLLDGLPRSATTVAAEHLTLATLTPGSLDRLMREQPAIAATFLLRCAQSLSQRLRKASRSLADFLD